MSTTETRMDDGRGEWKLGARGPDDGFFADAPSSPGDEREYLAAPDPEVLASHFEPFFDAAAVRDCTDTLTPLIERAAATCESLRESCRIAAPTDAELRKTLSDVASMLDRAASVVPALEDATVRGEAVAGRGVERLTGDEVRGLVYDAIASMREELESRAGAERARIDRLENELNERVAELGDRVPSRSGDDFGDLAGVDALRDELEGGAVHTPFSLGEAAEAEIQSAIDRAIGEGVTRTMMVWERETVQLMDVFRARVERAISSVESAAAERARQLDELCGKADRIFAQSGGDPQNLTNVVGELVESMRPWRGLLVEGKCGPDLTPLVQTIVDRVRADVRGEFAGRFDELDASIKGVVARSEASVRPRGTELDEVVAAGGTVQIIDQGEPCREITPVAPASKKLRVGPSGVNAAAPRAVVRSATRFDGAGAKTTKADGSVSRSTGKSEPVAGAAGTSNRSSKRRAA